MIGPVSPDRFWGEAGQQEDEDKETKDQESGQDVEEAAKAKLIRMEHAPYQREIEDHMATRVPFRSWCPSVWQEKP